MEDFHHRAIVGSCNLGRCCTSVVQRYVSDSMGKKNAPRNQPSKTPLVRSSELRKFAGRAPRSSFLLISHPPANVAGEMIVISSSMALPIILPNFKNRSRSVDFV